MLTHAEWKAMVEVQVAALRAELPAWCDVSAVAERVAEQLSECLDRCTNRRIAEERFASLGLSSPEHYFERVLEFEGGKLLCGIRFKGGDATQPFVDLVGSTQPIGDLGAAIKGALSVYETFHVTRARIFRSKDLGSSSICSRGDQVLLAAPLDAIAENGSASSIALEVADVDEAFEFVGHRYDAFATARPEVAPRVPPAEREELAECDGQGKLCWWLIDGERAGLIAVRRGKWPGLDGFEMVEEIVAEAFLGRRTAALAQRKLAAALIADGHDESLTLHGTIDCQNHASRRAARAAGRLELATWWFVSPTDER